MSNAQCKHQRNKIFSKSCRSKKSSCFSADCRMRLLSCAKCCRQILQKKIEKIKNVPKSIREDNLFRANMHYRFPIQNESYDGSVNSNDDHNENFWKTWNASTSEGWAQLKNLRPAPVAQDLAWAVASLEGGNCWAISWGIGIGISWGIGR